MVAERTAQAREMEDSRGRSPGPSRDTYVDIMVPVRDSSEAPRKRPAKRQRSVSVSRGRRASTPAPKRRRPLPEAPESPGGGIVPETPPEIEMNVPEPEPESEEPLHSEPGPSRMEVDPPGGDDSGEAGGSGENRIVWSGDRYDFDGTTWKEKRPMRPSSPIVEEPEIQGTETKGQASRSPEAPPQDDNADHRSLSPLSPVSPSEPLAPPEIIREPSSVPAVAESETQRTQRTPSPLPPKPTSKSPPATNTVERRSSPALPAPKESEEPGPSEPVVSENADKTEKSASPKQSSPATPPSPIALSLTEAVSLLNTPNGPQTLSRMQSASSINGTSPAEEKIAKEAQDSPSTSSTTAGQPPKRYASLTEAIAERRSPAAGSSTPSKPSEGRASPHGPASSTTNGSQTEAAISVEVKTNGDDEAKGKEKVLSPPVEVNGTQARNTPPAASKESSKPQSEEPNESEKPSSDEPNAAEPQRSTTPEDFGPATEYDRASAMCDDIRRHINSWRRDSDLTPQDKRFHGFFTQIIDTMVVKDFPVPEFVMKKIATELSTTGKLAFRSVFRVLPLRDVRSPGTPHQFPGSRLIINLWSSPYDGVQMQMHCVCEQTVL